MKIIEFDKDEPGFKNPSSSKPQVTQRPQPEPKRVLASASRPVGEVKIVEFGIDEPVFKPQPALRHNAPSAGLPRSGEVKIVEFDKDEPGFKPQAEVQARRGTRRLTGDGYQDRGIRQKRTWVQADHRIQA